MNAAADFLIKHSEDKSQKQHDEYRISVGTTICLIHEGGDVAYFLWEDPCDSSEDDALADTANLKTSEPEGSLAAAAVCGCSAAVNDLFPKLADPLETTSWTMGDGLTAAAVNNRADTAALLYQLSADRATNVSPLDYNRGMFWNT